MAIIKFDQFLITYIQLFFSPNTTICMRETPDKRSVHPLAPPIPFSSVPSPHLKNASVHTCMFLICKISSEAGCLDACLDLILTRVVKKSDLAHAVKSKIIHLFSVAKS